MWPMLLDYSRDECKRILRKLELEAYAAIISAFRAQGNLTKEKKKLLQDLCAILSISLERHRAEIRRAVNDERLNTIADRITGPNTLVDWSIEGRRLIPLMPRLVPQTAFTAVANSVACIQAAKNASLPLPSASSIKDSTAPTTSSAPPTPSCTPTPTQQCRVAISGTVPMKTTSVNENNTGLNMSGIGTKLPQETSSENILADDSTTNKRKRSASLDIAAIPEKIVTYSCPTSASSENQLPDKSPTNVSNGTLPVATSVTTQACTTKSSYSAAPIRITLPSSQKQSTTISSSSPAPKQVVLMTASNSSTSSAILQRSVNIPIVKTVSTTAATITQKQSKLSSCQSVQGTLLVGKITTATTSGQMHPVSMPLSFGAVATLARPCSKTLPPPRQIIKPRASVLPISSQNRMQLVGQNFSSQSQVSICKPSLQMGTPIQLKQIPAVGRTALQIHHEGVKIVAQGLPVSANKILPKPATTSVVMVSSTQTLSTSSKSLTSSTITQNPVCTKVVSLSPSQVQSGGKITPVGNVSLVSRTPQGFIGKSGSTVVPSPGLKPNVIVVHKAQVWPQSQGQGTTIVVSGSSVPKLSAEAVQEAMTYIQKQERNRSNIPATVVTVSSSNTITTVSTSTTSTIGICHSSTLPRNQGNITLSSDSKSQITQISDKVEIDKKNNLLADLIEASGILSEGAESSFPASSHVKTSLSMEEEKIAEGVKTIINETENNDLEMEADKVSSEVLNLDESWIEEARLEEQVAQLENSEIEKTTEQAEDVLDVDPTLNLEDINLPLNQLEEGEILEIQTQDDVEVLGQSTRLTKEMLELLQQAGLQIQEVEVKNNVPNEPIAVATCSNIESTTKSIVDSAEKDENTVQLNKEENDVSKLAKPTMENSCEKIIVCHKVEECELSKNEKPLENPTKANTTDKTFEIKEERKYEDMQKIEQENVIELLNSEFDVVQLHTPRFIETGSSVISGTELVKHCPQHVDDDSCSKEATNNQFKTKTYKPIDNVKINYISSAPQEKMKDIFQKETELSSEDVKNLVNTEVYSNVRVEPSGLDTSTMNLEDFTSQRVEGSVAEQCNEDISNHEMESSVVTVITSQKDDNVPENKVIESVKQSECPSEVNEEQESPAESSNVDIPVRRKRKFAVELNELPHLTGWSRMASGLLEKVCKYRGTGRLVGAAHWFLQPVISEDAPGYYDVVKEPMDFSTIKKKLENGCYKNLGEFHSDMMLVKSNCELYNPPGHEARTDGEEVFSFYLQEYNRIVEKWQKNNDSVNKDSTTFSNKDKIEIEDSTTSICY